VTDTLTFNGTLKITTCWCGIVMAIPSDLYRYASNNKGFSVYCPLGHQWVFTETEAERQRKRADDAERQLRYARARATSERDQRLASERSNRAYRGWITRLRNRVANGVCPVNDCHRHFENVERHIATVHPDWAATHPEVLAS
jgi:hypothetical protein